MTRADGLGEDLACGRVPRLGSDPEGASRGSAPDPGRASRNVEVRDTSRRLFDAAAAPKIRISPVVKAVPTRPSVASARRTAMYAFTKVFPRSNVQSRRFPFLRNGYIFEASLRARSSGLPFMTYVFAGRGDATTDDPRRAAAAASLRPRWLLAIFRSSGASDLRRTHGYVAAAPTSRLGVAVPRRLSAVCSRVCGEGAREVDLTPG